MADIISGSSRSPESRRVANAFCRAVLLDFVIDVAEDIILRVGYRAVIPNGNAVGALQSLHVFYPVQSSAKLLAVDAKSATDLVCRVSRIAPDDPRRPPA